MRNCTIRIAKTKALISFTVTAKLICVFIFAYAKSRFSHNGAQLKPVPTTYFMVKYVNFEVYNHKHVVVIHYICIISKFYIHVATFLASETVGTIKYTEFAMRIDSLWALVYLEN